MSTRRASRCARAGGCEDDCATLPGVRGTHTPSIFSSSPPSPRSFKGYKKVTVDAGPVPPTREELLLMRTKHKSDKFC